MINAGTTASDCIAANCFAAANAPEHGGPEAASEEPDDDDAGDVPEGDAFWRTILDPLTDVTLASIHLGGHLWGQFLGLRNDPTGIRNYARVAAAIAQEVGKRMLARARGAAPGTYTGGRIVNIASMAGLKVLPQIGVYCMSKAAVVQMTKAMALEWGRFGINVNAICPGLTETGMTIVM